MPGRLVRSAGGHLVFAPDGHLVWDNAYTRHMFDVPSWYKSKTSSAYSATDTLSLSNVYPSPVFADNLTDGAWTDIWDTPFMSAVSSWSKSYSGSGAYYSVTATLTVSTHRFDMAGNGLQGYALKAIKKDFYQYNNASTDGTELRMGIKTNDATSPSPGIDWITDSTYVVLTTGSETIYTLATPLVLSSNLWLTLYISNSFRPPDAQYTYPSYARNIVSCSYASNPYITLYFDRP